MAHVSPEEAGKSSTNEVDGHAVPAKHFGLILEWEQWEELAELLQEQDVEFIIKPYVRFEGESGEQMTMFLKDPSGNTLNSRPSAAKSRFLQLVYSLE